MSATFGTDKLNDYWWTNEMYESVKQEQMAAIRSTGCTCHYDFYVVNNGKPAATLEQQTKWTSPGCPVHGDNEEIAIMEPTKKQQRKLALARVRRLGELARIVRERRNCTHWHSFKVAKRFVAIYGVTQCQ